MIRRASLELVERCHVPASHRCKNQFCCWSIVRMMKRPFDSLLNCLSLPYRLSFDDLDMLPRARAKYDEELYTQNA